MKSRDLDNYITGHGGEDQLLSLCPVCGKKFDASAREDYAYSSEPDDIPETCSRACDLEADARFTERITSTSDEWPSWCGPDHDPETEG